MFGGGTRSQVVVASKVEDMICDDKYIQVAKRSQWQLQCVAVGSSLLARMGSCLEGEGIKIDLAAESGQEAAWILGEALEGGGGRRLGWARWLSGCLMTAADIKPIAWPGTQRSGLRRGQRD